MSKRIETIKITDEHGFIHEVSIEHRPHFGFSTAFYDGGIIANVELYRIYQPMSDNDGEWERYEELFSEWTDEIKVNLIPQCQEYFNKKNR